MQKNIKILIICTLIFILSVAAGFMIIKRNPIVPPDETKPATSVAEVSNTIETDENQSISVYLIKLSDNMLEMYCNDEVIKQSEVPADVFPPDDISELSMGKTYLTFEEALADWESLVE